MEDLAAPGVEVATATADTSALVSKTPDVIAPLRDAKGRLLPGHTANPGGRRRTVKKVVALARAHTVEAIQALLEVVQTSPDDRARIAAAQALLDRGWGKPSESVDVTSNGEKINPTAQVMIVNGKEVVF